MFAFTVAASVFVNAFHADEDGHTASRLFLSRVRAADSLLIVPTLLFAEVAGAVARGCDDSDLGRDFAETVSQIANLTAVSLDRRLAHQTAALAAEYRLRGSDAVYGAVAQRFGSLLVTRDREQWERLSSVVETRWPEEVEF